MPFARFMELALYDPDGGYYRSAEARPGRGGDFITAPELIRSSASCWRGPSTTPGWPSVGRNRSSSVEHGAGEGALAVS